MEWEGRKVLVLGLGDTGLSSIRWLEKRGAQVRAADTREAPPALGTVQAEHPRVPLALGAFREALLEGVDTVVASPGVALREPVLRAALERGIEVVGDVEIFARELARRGDRARVLGVTGTNGKSTVTALACDMARAAGLRAQAVGNIGAPVLDALEERGREAPAELYRGREAPAELYILELSSYQLETTASLALDAGAVLNVTQDHLDRYDSFEDYAQAKARIFMDCRTRVLNRDDAVSLAMSAGGAEVLTFGLGVPANRLEWGLDERHARLLRGPHDLLGVDEIGIPGLHNAANALAAHALGSAIALPEEAMARAIREFRGLPHRVELVAEVAGARYYDDSKGTNVGASVAALEGFSVPVVLIAGGDGKGQDFSSLASAVRAHARAVVLIGRDAETLAAALGATGVPLVRAQTMDDAVAAAHALARPGDVVLLSPACASFDMFRNYGHRGDVFARAARSLGTGHDSTPDVPCLP